MWVLYACTKPGPTDPPPPTDATAEHSATPTDSPLDTGSRPPAPNASPGCGNTSLVPGSFEEHLTVDGVDRRFLLEIPAAHDGVTPIPLVLDFHGTDGSPQEQRLIDHLDRAAQDDGFVVAFPESLSDGAFKVWTITCQSDDIDFVDALLDDLQEHLCLDTARVVVTGHSNGGYFANVLGSVLQDRVAAIAPIASGPGAVPFLCRPPGPLPVTIVNGTTDAVVDYSEGEATRDLWSNVDHCGSPTTDADGCERCTGDAAVRFCSAEGVGHLTIYQRYPTSDRIRDLVAATESP